MSSASDDGGRFSCSTNYAKDVLDQLHRAKLSGPGWGVCSYAHNLSFGNAGSRRRRGESELSCTFDLASWARHLNMNRSHLQRILKRVVDCHILSFAPLEPGRATLTWNLTFTEWTIYDHRRLPEQAQRLNTIPAIDVPKRLSLPDKGDVPKRLSSVEDERTITSKPDSLKRTITSKDGSFGANAQQVAFSPNKGTNKSTKKEETYIAPANAAQGSLFPVLPIATQEKTPGASDGSKKERKPDPLWDAAVTMLGRFPQTDSERGAWNHALKELRAANVTPEELSLLWATWPKLFKDARCTLNAIAKHLSDLRAVYAASIGVPRHADPEIYAHYL